jgi:hypothetical protein
MPSFPHNVTFLPGLSPTVFPNTHLTPYGTFYGSAGFPLNGLVWNFTDNVAYAGAVHDSTAYGNDLVLSSGWYPSLDGIGDYIEIPHTASLDISDRQVVMKIRFKPTAFGTSQLLMTTGSWATAGGWELFLRLDGKVEFASTQGSVNSYHTRYTFGATVAGVWNTLKLTVSGMVATKATLNGVSVAITEHVAPTGTYGDPGLGLRFGATFNPAWYFAGELSDISISSVGSWLLNEHADELDAGLNGLPCFDRSGNGNHGEYVMCSGNVGEGMPIPQTALQDWNQAINFASSGSVAIGDGDPLSLSGAGKVEFRAWVYFTGETPSVAHPLFSYYVSTGTSGFTPAINTSGELRIAGRSRTVDSFQNYAVASPSVGWHYVKLYLDYANDEGGISIDNAAYTTSALSFGASTFTPGANINQNIIGELSSVSGAVFDSIIRDAEIWIDDVLTNSWDLHGTDDLTDKTGSVDGTASGTLVDTYIPASLADPTKDALGNDIDNPRGELLNPRGVAGDYAEILDDPSLDVTTEWSGAIVGNLWDDELTTKYLYHRFDSANNKRSWGFVRSSSYGSSDDGKLRILLSPSGTSTGQWSGDIDVPNRNAVLSWSYNGTAGTFFIYIDGVKYTPTTVSGTIPASLFTPDTQLPIRLFQDFDGNNPSDKQFLPPLMYNRELSPSEHSDLYEKLQGLL